MRCVDLGVEFLEIWKLNFVLLNGKAKGAVPVRAILANVIFVAFVETASFHFGHHPVFQFFC